MSVLPQIAFDRGIRGCGHVSILTGYVSANGHKNRSQLEGIVPHGMCGSAGKVKNKITNRSSAAEYLTYVASVGDQQDSIEMRYEDENIWLTQKRKMQLSGISG